MSSPLGCTGRLVCSLGVKDHKAASDWYITTLGCEVEFQNDEMGMSFLKTPVENVYLDLSQVEAPAAGGGATLVWSVGDAHDSRKALEDLGVRFDGPTRELGGMVRLATFFDPDGNTHMVYQSLSK